MSSIVGENIKVSVFGQSHSKAIGVVIDGLPAGLTIDMEELKAFMKRERKRMCRSFSLGWWRIPLAVRHCVQ